MRKILRPLAVLFLVALAAELSGCTALQKKFTPKKKEKKARAYYQVREYDVKPSMELYEKHYVFWINWQREIIEKLGKNYKSNRRCIDEITGNLRDMAGLLVDEKSEQLKPHLEALDRVKVIIDKRNMTKANETRIRQVLEREYRLIKREFSPREMVGCIRKEFKSEEEWSE